MTWLEVIGLLTLWTVGGVAAFYAGFLGTMRGRDLEDMLFALLFGAASAVVWTGAFWWWVAT